MPRFDRSYLPPAALEFVVIADTHHIVDPGMYSAEGDSVTPELTKDWSARGDLALAWAKDLGPLLTFHLGDLQQEYPGHASFDAGRRAAIDQLQRAGFPMQQVAGNMDIGDKPDPTMPAGWLRQEYLSVWDEDFGRSFHSLDQAGFHFVILNSQLLNSDLADREAQRSWLEEDLRAHTSARIVLFLHVPPFVVDEDEPGLGSYDVIDEPDRSWLLGLLRRFRVEAMFCGHTHFRLFNRVGGTRVHVAPSTTTTRPGFYEAMAAPPPGRGWADTKKLGFLLARATDEGLLEVRPIRTDGRTDLLEGKRSSILTATSAELPGSPLGTYLRLPIANQSDGAIIYPYHVRHRIRDDYPLLACIELGLRHVRFPVHDMTIPLLRDRLTVLRDEGVALTATVISDGGASFRVQPVDDVDDLEIQTAGSVVPRESECAAIASVRPGLRVSLAPIVVEATGKVHGRSRVGYRLGELPVVNDALANRGIGVDRALCLADGGSEAAWEAILAFGRLETPSIGALDFIVPLAGDDVMNQLTLAYALLAVSTVPNARLFIDPLQELDREAAVMGGLLDRLSNPRASYHLVRVLNSVLFGSTTPTAYTPCEMGWGGSRIARGVTDGKVSHWLVTQESAADMTSAMTAASAAGAVKWIDLVHGESVAELGLHELTALIESDRDVVSLVSVGMQR